MKITKKEIIEYDIPIPVYDITVKNNLNMPNFLISNGIFLHNCCGVICHAGAIAKGSSTVFVNNLDITRMGDSHTCGDTAGAHSPDVYAGG